MIETLLAGTVALVAHELGHVVTATARGLAVRRVGISWRRVCVAIEAGSSRDQLCIAAAGPVASFAVALAFVHIWPALTLYSLVFGLVSLLPMKGSDSLRIISAAKAVQAKV